VAWYLSSTSPAFLLVGSLSHGTLSTASLKAMKCVVSRDSFSLGRYMCARMLRSCHACTALEYMMCGANTCWNLRTTPFSNLSVCRPARGSGGLHSNDLRANQSYPSAFRHLLVPKSLSSAHFRRAVFHKSPCRYVVRSHFEVKFVRDPLSWLFCRLSFRSFEWPLFFDVCVRFAFRIPFACFPFPWVSHGLKIFCFWGGPC
jgi:hypothetical protein